MGRGNHYDHPLRAVVDSWLLCGVICTVHGVISILYLLWQDSDMAGFKAHFIATAKAVDDGLHFIFAESSANNGALQYFGLKDEDVPAYVIHDSKTDAKFVRKNADPADLTKFLSEFKVFVLPLCHLWS